MAKRRKSTRKPTNGRFQTTFPKKFSTPVPLSDRATAPLFSGRQKSPQLLKEEASLAMQPMEVDVHIPCTETSDIEAECWSDNGMDSVSEWEEARDQGKQARTMIGDEGHESGRFDQSRIDKGRYPVGGATPRTGKEKKLKTLQAGDPNQRQYEKLCELLFKGKHNDDLKRNTPTSVTMFPRKRPLTPTDVAEVEHLAKRPRLSEDDGPQLGEIELEGEETTEVAMVTDSWTDEVPNDRPAGDAPVVMSSDDEWSSESEDELELGRRVGRVDFKEMKEEVKQQLRQETKVANMKAVRVLASLCDFYDKVEMAGRIRAGKLASKMVGRGPSYARRIQAQARHFEQHHCLLPFNQGKRVGLKGLLSEEDVRMQIVRWLRKLPAGTVKPKLLANQVNKVILPQFNLQKVAISTRQARRWLHFFGYQERRHRKGVYWDGHERPDVVADRHRYLEEIQVVQKLSREWIEVEDEIIEVLPQIPEGEKEHVILYHDECACHGNERSDRYWLKEGQQVLHRKDTGRLMMVSEFITGSTPSGRLLMSEEQTREQACLPKSERLPPSSRKMIFPTGKPGGDSYWNMDQMIAQIKETIRLGEYLLPNTTLVFIFDNSSAHNSRATDALQINNMNVYPGGVASIMHDTIIPADNPHGKAGQSQVMQFTANLGLRHNHDLRMGQPKGIAMTLEERGFVQWVSARKVVRTADGQKIPGECEKCKKAKARKPRSQVSMLLDIEDDADDTGWEDDDDDDDDDEGEPECCLRKMLSQQSDFINEKSLLYQTISNAGHKCIFLPKFHCELNPIEYYWAWVKRVFREQCDGNFTNSKKLFTEMLDACPGDVIRRFLRRVDRYASAYRLGATGLLADYAVKMFRSHRSITSADLSRAKAEKASKSNKIRKNNVH